MTKQIQITKENKASDPLWWQQAFSFQSDMNKQLQESFRGFSFPSFISPSFMETQQNIFAGMRDNLHRFLSEAFNNNHAALAIGPGVMPVIDIIENGSKFTIKAEVAGINAEDLDVSYSKNSLTIKGSKEEEKEEEEGNLIRQECKFGSFSRTIALPEQADVEKAQATFSNGTLSIDIPKKSGVRKAYTQENNKEKSIPVKENRKAA